METETKLNSVEHQLLSLILPAGLLDYFEIKSVREIKIGYEVLLEEKSDIPIEYNNEPIITLDFTQSKLFTFMIVVGFSIPLTLNNTFFARISHLPTDLDR